MSNPAQSPLELPPLPPAVELTALELELLRDAIAGRTVAESAARLHYSTSYVNRVRGQLYVRLGAANVAQAAAIATRLGVS